MDMHIIHTARLSRSTRGIVMLNSSSLLMNTLSMLTCRRNPLFSM